MKKPQLTGQKGPTSYWMGASWHVMAAFLRRNGCLVYTPSHFQWTWDDLGHSPFSKFLQYHHHPSKKPPRKLEVSARIPLVICLWTASEVTQMLTFDAWTSDWRFPQYPPILCCMSRVCFSKMLQVNLLHSICKACFFFNIWCLQMFRVMLSFHQLPSQG